MNAKLVSQLTGLSIRTLHHYDEIQLLSPKRNPDNDYREYSDEDLNILQQILFFKECGFSLAKIKEIITSPTFDRLQAFELQKNHLIDEKNRIETMIETIIKSIKNIKGEITMSNKEKFEGFDFSKNPYEEEARKRWGDEVIDKSKAHLASYSKEDQKEMEKRMGHLFARLASIRHLDPASPEVQKEMTYMFAFFNNSFGYTYSLEAFGGLGQMYVQDERFTKNIDQFGEGLAKFLSEAMTIFSKTNP